MKNGAPHCDWVWEGSLRFPRRYIESFSEKMWFYLKKEKEFLLACQGQKKLQEISILVVRKAPAKKYNSQYRKKNYATDVLSFPGEWTWGDLILCDEVIAENARAHGISYREELAYVFLHGILHLYGFDHESSPEDERLMFGLQDRVFNKVMKSMGARTLVIL
jgi:probable rRNA maturation factor